MPEKNQHSGSLCFLASWGLVAIGCDRVAIGCDLKHSGFPGTCDRGFPQLDGSGSCKGMSIQEAAMPANQFLHALGFERCLKQHPFLKIILPLIVELLGQITSNLESDM